MRTQRLVPLRTAKSLLTYRGCTMVDAATATAMDYGHLRKVLAGQEPVTRQFMRRLAVWLGYSEHLLFPEVMGDLQTSSTGGDAQ